MEVKNRLDNDLGNIMGVGDLTLGNVDKLGNSLSFFLFNPVF